MFLDDKEFRPHLKDYSVSEALTMLTVSLQRTKTPTKNRRVSYMKLNCVWWWDGDRQLYWPQVLLTIAALLPHLGWGCSTVGHREPQALSLQADSHAGILFPTDSNSLKPSVPWLYFRLTSTYFCCSSAYLHRCITWLTARSRVSILHKYLPPTLGFFLSQYWIIILNGKQIRKNGLVWFG